MLSACALWPTIIHAQHGGKVARLGYLFPKLLNPGVAKETLVSKLRELGWEEGRNLAVAGKAYGPDLRELDPAAADFLREKVDVIVVVSTNVALAVQAVTRTIPIVILTGSDPVGVGAAVSLARPGGMITGLTLMSPETIVKRVEHLVKMLPHPERIAVLENPNSRSMPHMLQTVIPAIQSFGLTARTFQAGAAGDIESAFDQMKSWAADGVVILDDPMFYVIRDKLANAGKTRGLPLACHFREMAEAGCLFSYSANIRERIERGAAYVDKILRGANPAELPFEQPTRFELVINLVTAKTLGIEIPALLLATADDVIE